ncbi:hypothetical protein BaRGS_00031570 [Batillaria attramentaria]|uniref:Uncharacterized protein n=1 Tax=Batillaria attramentaria TaxID=370345 RepID=A0ABD0JQ66_9CAEN
MLDSDARHSPHFRKGRQQQESLPLTCAKRKPVSIIGFRQRVETGRFLSTPTVCSFVVLADLGKGLSQSKQTMENPCNVN